MRFQILTALTMSLYVFPGCNAVSIFGWLGLSEESIQVQ
jgi:hypothetical protein